MASKVMKARISVNKETSQPEHLAEESERLAKAAEQLAKATEQLAKETQQVTKETEQVTKESEQLTTEFFQTINEALAPKRTLPGFADPRVERVSNIELPPWFIDRCRRAYLSVPFDSEAECRVLGVTSASPGEARPQSPSASRPRWRSIRRSPRY